KDLGPVALGATGSTQLTLQNIGQTPTGTLSAMLSGSAAFTVSMGCTTLAAGATCPVTVSFSPTAVAAATPGLPLPATGSSATAALSGTGTATVTVTNAGGGRVTSSPAGIDCGTICTFAFARTPVTLTATPDGNHTFGGWSGACTGTGTCSLSLTRARSVTATFNPKTAALALAPTSQSFGTVA